MKFKQLTSLILAGLIFLSPGPLLAATGCSYPTSLDSFADKVANDFLTVADVNKTHCAIEKLEAGPLRLDDGTAGAPSYAFRTSATAGMYLSAADEISWSTSSTQFLRLTSAGVLEPVGTGKIKATDFELVASDDTEDTTTSTTDVDIVTISGLSLTVNTPFLVVTSLRKSTGTAATASVGLKVNSTIVRSPDVWAGSSANAREGFFWVFSGSRDSTYTESAFTVSGSNGNDPTWYSLNNLAWPNATITSITIRGKVSNADNTMGVNFTKIYALVGS